MTAKRATERFYLALPAGYLAAGETPLEAAQRELREEAGLTGVNWRRVGELDPLPGYVKSKAYVLRCDVALLDVADLGSAPNADSDEDVEVHVMSRDEVHGRIVEGELVEMQAVAAILLAEAVERAHPPPPPARSR